MQLILKNIQSSGINLTAWEYPMRTEKHWFIALAGPIDNATNLIHAFVDVTSSGGDGVAQSSEIRSRHTAWKCCNKQIQEEESKLGRPRPHQVPYRLGIAFPVEATSLNSCSGNTFCFSSMYRCVPCFCLIFGKLDEGQPKLTHHFSHLLLCLHQSLCLHPSLRP